MDFCPVTSVEGVKRYAAKYASKGETKSFTFQEMLQEVCHSKTLERDMLFGLIHYMLTQVITHLNDADHVQVAYQKLLSSLVGERDYSGQEVCHILLGCQLFRSSRQTRSLCVDPNPATRLEFQVSSQGERHTLQDYYIARPPHLNHISLFTFCKKYETPGYSERGRDPARRNAAKEYVVDVWPRFKGDTQDEDAFEKFAYAKLKLHHPFRLEEDLWGDYTSSTEAFTRCLELCPPHPRDPLGPPIEPTEGNGDDNESSDGETMPDDEESQPVQLAWQVEVGRRPNAPVQHELH